MPSRMPARTRSSGSGSKRGLVSDNVSRRAASLRLSVIVRSEPLIVSRSELNDIEIGLDGGRVEIAGAFVELAGQEVGDAALVERLLRRAARESVVHRDQLH